MRADDKQLGKPETLFKDTTANIEAIASPVEGMKAYSTDDHLEGYYNGSEWVWSTGGSATAFTNLTDTFDYAGLGGEYVKVKATEDGLETGTPAGGGDVLGSTSVADGHLAVFDMDGYHIKDGGAVPAGGSTPDYILLRDEKPQNTPGGTFTSGAWQIRVVNTEVIDTGNHCSLPGSNVIRLEAGTYRYKIGCCAEYVNLHKARLWDVTADAVVANGEGTNAYSGAGAGLSTGVSWLVGEFTIAAQNDFRIEHRCQTTNNNAGFGTASNWDKEIYLVAEFMKIS